MNLDSAFAQIRPVFHLAASILVIVAVCKFFGLNIPVSGEYWQIALLALGCKAI